jgi:organic radical activating enzyme
MIDEDYFLVSSEQKKFLEEFKRLNDNIEEGINNLILYTKDTTDNMRTLNTNINVLNNKIDLIICKVSNENNINEDIKELHRDIKSINEINTNIEKKIDYINSMNAFNPFIKKSK